jgi:hypothetical protein
MDYKRAYEELREVYLKDKQAADELAELAAWYFEATYLVLPKPPICLPVKQRSKIHLNAFWEIVDIIAEAEAALHKAVGREE